MNECVKCNRETKEERLKCNYCILSNKSFITTLLIVGFLMLPIAYSSLISAIQIGIPGTLNQFYEASMLWFAAIIGASFFVLVLKLIYNKKGV